MRIKKIAMKNYGEIQNFSASFSKNDKLIYVLENTQLSEDLFEYSGFIGFWDVFFSPYDENCSFGERDSRLEYVCERGGKTFSARAEGCFRERKSKDGKITLTQGVKQSFTYPADLDGETAHRARLCREWYLYPQKMRTFGSFSAFYDEFRYSMETLCREVERGDDRGYLTEKEIAAVKGKFRKFLRGFSPIPLDETHTLTFQKNGGYQVLDEGGTPVTNLSADERIRAEFLSWATAVAWIRETAEALGREGEYPVILKYLFFYLDEGKDKKMLFDALRKTGAQVFLCERERNAELEKYCDKVLLFE